LECGGLFELLVVFLFGGDFEFVEVGVEVVGWDGDF